MSEYLEIYARKGDNFVFLLAHCRSSLLFRTLGKYAPYERIRRVTPAIIDRALSDIRADCDAYSRSIDRTREIIRAVGSFEGSYEDKIDHLYDLMRDVDEYQDMIKDAHRYEAQLELLRQMVSDVDENADEDVSKEETGIYFGIECGPAVSVNDITT